MANSTVDMMPGGLESDEETSVIINSVLNALLIPICIAGNVLVLAAVWRNPSLRTPSIILLCSLAVSDLLVGFLALPLDIAVALTQRFLGTVLTHVCHKQGSSSLFNSAVFRLP